mgnify:CR=1 FL=1
MQNYKNFKNGQILVIGLVILFVISLIVLSTTIVTTRDVEERIYSDVYDENYYTAESRLYQVYEILKNNKTLLVSGKNLKANLEEGLSKSLFNDPGYKVTCDPVNALNSDYLCTLEENGITTEISIKLKNQIDDMQISSSDVIQLNLSKVGTASYTGPIRLSWKEGDNLIWSIGLIYERDYEKDSGINPIINQCNSISSKISDMVSCWTFDGGLTRDFYGSNDGTNNGATSVAGYLNEAFNFNGNTNSILVPDNNSLDVSDKITISVWVKPNNITGSNMIVMKGQSSGNLVNYALRITGGQIDFFYGNTVWQGWRTTNANLVNGVWQHIVAAGTIGANHNMRIYVNGKLLTSVCFWGNCDLLPVTNNSYFRIGHSDGYGQNFNGIIDELTFFNRQLNSSEVNLLYQYSPSMSVSDSTKYYEIVKDVYDGILATNRSAGIKIFTFNNHPEGLSSTHSFELLLDPATINDQKFIENHGKLLYLRLRPIILNGESTTISLKGDSDLSPQFIDIKSQAYREGLSESTPTPLLSIKGSINPAPPAIFDYVYYDN